MAEGTKETIPVSERWDRVFRTLSAEPRRQVILSLMEAPPGQGVTLPEAAEPPDADVDRDDFEVTLRHQHLPMLADAGYVRWSDAPFSVRRGPYFEEAAAIVESFRANVDELPERLVLGCHYLEQELGERVDD